MKVGAFFRSCLVVVSGRMKLLSLFSLLFFGGVFVIVVAAQFLLLPPLFLGWSPRVPEVFVWEGALLVFGIFVYNLVVNALIMVTLSGFAFFPLSTSFLLYKAVLWGMFLYNIPTWLFLAALPVIVLEGEAYVVCAVGGTVVGVSWVKPEWAYPSVSLSRFKSFRKGVRECLKFYLLAVLLLLAAAVAETTIIVYV